jgi:hypothetical protein
MILSLCKKLRAANSRLREFSFGLISLYPVQGMESGGRYVLNNLKSVMFTSGGATDGRTSCGRKYTIS